MKFIIVSGMDGSGKTTIIDALREKIELDNKKTLYVWLRFNHILCKPVHALCRLLRLSRRIETQNGYKWKHEFYKSQMFCSLYIVMTWLDTWFGRIRLQLRLRKKYDYVICDRWVNDILVDLVVKTKRTNIMTSEWYRRFQIIQPNGSWQFIINRDRDSILSCRSENRDDPDLEIRNKMYRWISTETDAIAIDNCGTINEAVDKIYEAVVY